jgi:hypothetical protein
MQRAAVASAGPSDSRAIDITPLQHAGGRGLRPKSANRLRPAKVCFRKSRRGGRYPQVPEEVWHQKE